MNPEVSTQNATVDDAFDFYARRLEENRVNRSVVFYMVVQMFPQFEAELYAYDHLISSAHLAGRYMYDYMLFEDLEYAKFLFALVIKNRFNTSDIIYYEEQ